MNLRYEQNCLAHTMVLSPDSTRLLFVQGRHFGLTDRDARSLRKGALLLGGHWRTRRARGECRDRVLARIAGRRYVIGPDASWPMTLRSVRRLAHAVVQHRALEVEREVFLSHCVGVHGDNC